MRSCRSSCARTSLAPTSRPHARLPKIDSVQPALDSRIGCRRIHRRNATSAQAASTNPNGHAPWRKPYAEPSPHATAKPRTNQ
jgi:hypothetical protein